MSPALSHTSSVPEAAAPAVVLVHFGDPANTARCLRSLAAQETLKHRAVVVDHGPGAELDRALAGLHPDLRILPAHDNPGFGAGCNLGAELAFREGAEGVWFLNNDARLDGPTLGELLERSRAHREVAFWGHTQLDGGRPVGADQHPAWYASPRTQHPSAPPGCRFLASSESLSGASLYVPRWQWERVGPWPADFFLYYEDAAYCRRVHALGLPIALLDRRILHDRGTTTGRRSPLTVFYGVRNRLLLHAELLPEARAARLLMGLDLLQKRFFQGRWGLLRPTFRGWLAAARNRRGRDPRY